MTFRSTAPLLLCAVLVAGCGTPSISPEQRAGLEAPARSLEARGEWRQAALAWQQAADAANSTGQNNLGAAFRLNAADALLREGDAAGATAVVGKLPGELGGALGLRRALVLADASLMNNDPADALARIGPALTSQDPAIVSRYRRIRSEALELTGDALGAARERALLEPLLRDPEALYRNRQKTWELLGEVSDDVLALQPAAPPEVTSGWIELAGIARRHRLEADALDAAINEWSARYPAHPAGEQVVPELIEAVRADTTPPARVALLLPQSGPFASAAAAVRDGFMAAWFADSANEQRPEVALIDSSDGDPALAYASALSGGARFVIGPLAKESVNAVLRGADLSVTTLTLNYPSLDEALLTAPATGGTVGATTDSAPAAAGTVAAAPPLAVSSQSPPAAADRSGAPKDLGRVFHFALSPEDEAARAAEHAYARGARQAGVLGPDGDWGLRIAEAFSARFQELGGVVATTQTFPEEATGLSEAVERLLNIDQSKQRGRALRAALARNINHEPEPRSDLDVVFLAAFPQTARQLRPLLQFHRADDVPVVATSHVYAGRPDPGADQDIEGIVFGDMPWLLDPDSYTLPGQVARIWPAAGGSAGRLYAFGADAYALIARLRDLRGNTGGRHPGLTGTLSMGSDRRIRRDLEWAQIRGGVPVRLDADPTAAGGWGIVAR